MIRYRLGGLRGRRSSIRARRERRFRFCLPNTRFLLHQPMGGVQGPGNGTSTSRRGEIIKMREERLSQIISPPRPDQSIERVRKDTDRNYWIVGIRGRSTTALPIRSSVRSKIWRRLEVTQGVPSLYRVHLIAYRFEHDLSLI